jgi:hypothetical protein
MAFLEQRCTDHNTALGKVIPLIEETRMRVSALEIAVDGVTTDLAQVKAEMRREFGQVKAEQASFRRDFPSLVAEALREALKEQRGD